MLDVAPSEFLLLAIVALVVIGPKDLPKAMRVLGHWVGKARGVARSFRSGFDNMVRESELAEMEKKWAEENARIMREHSAGAVTEAAPAASVYDATAASAPAPAGASDDGVSSLAEPDLFSQPALVEPPVIRPDSASAGHDTTPSDGAVPTAPAAAASWVEADASTSAPAPLAAAASWTEAGASASAPASRAA